MFLKIDSGGNLLFSNKSPFRYIGDIGLINFYISSNGEAILYGTDDNSLSTKPDDPVKGHGNSFVYRIGSKEEMLWMRRFDYKGSRSLYLNLTTDDAGNAYLIGSNPPGTFRLGNQTITTPNNSEQLILMILDPQGNCMSLKVLATFANFNFDWYEPTSCALCFDKHGQLHIAYAEPTLNKRTGFSESDWLRIIRYDKDSGLLKRASFELGGIYTVSGLFIASNGNIYMNTLQGSIYYEYSEDFGYLVALDRDMNLLWNKELVCDFSVSPDGSLYFLTYFGFYVDIDGQIITTNAKYDDVCLGKISPAGQVEWLKSALLMK